RKDRPVTFTSRTVGRARPRTAHLDAIALLRRFLQHVLPDGLMKVRHCSLLHASGALPLATIRLMLGQTRPSEGPPPPRPPPPPRAARCPTCGAPLRVSMRLWTPPRALVDTGCVAYLCPDERGTTRSIQPPAPVRPHAGMRRLVWPDTGSATAFQRPTEVSRGSAEAPMAMPHHGVRRTIPPLS